VVQEARPQHLRRTDRRGTEGIGADRCDTAVGNGGTAWPGWSEDLMRGMAGRGRRRTG
jgi:hypothetical protein